MGGSGLKVFTATDVFLCNGIKTNLTFLLERNYRLLNA